MWNQCKIWMEPKQISACSILWTHPSWKPRISKLQRFGPCFEPYNNYSSHHQQSTSLGFVYGYLARFSPCWGDSAPCRGPFPPGCLCAASQQICEAILRAATGQTEGTVGGPTEPQWGVIQSDSVAIVMIRYRIESVCCFSVVILVPSLVDFELFLGRMVNDTLW